jgi:hypothetical protein
MATKKTQTLESMFRIRSWMRGFIQEPDIFFGEVDKHIQLFLQE